MKIEFVFLNRRNKGEERIVHEKFPIPTGGYPEVPPNTRLKKITIRHQSDTPKIVYVKVKGWVKWVKGRKNKRKTQIPIIPNITEDGIEFIMVKSPYDEITVEFFAEFAVTDAVRSMRGCFIRSLIHFSRE